MAAGKFRADRPGGGRRPLRGLGKAGAADDLRPVPGAGASAAGRRAAALPRRADKRPARLSGGRRDAAPADRSPTATVDRKHHLLSVLLAAAGLPLTRAHGALHAARSRVRAAAAGSASPFLRRAGVAGGGDHWATGGRPGRAPGAALRRQDPRLRRSVGARQGRQHFAEKEVEFGNSRNLQKIVEYENIRRIGWRPWGGSTTSRAGSAPRRPRCRTASSAASTTRCARISA